MGATLAEERRAEDISLTGFSQQQTQLLQELAGKFGLDQAATQRLGEQLRDLSRVTGTDFNMLLSALRDIRRSGETGFIYDVPHTDTRTADLAMTVLSQAYGVYDGRPRARPDFSAGNLGAAAESFLRGHSMTGVPFQIGPRTTRWLERQAERNRMDPFALSTATMGYCALRGVDPDLAEGYLRAASAEDPRIAAFARMFQQGAQSTVLDDGRTSFWLRTTDAVELAGDFRREQLLGSRLRRA